MSLADLALDPMLSLEATVLVDRTPLQSVEPAVGLFLAPELVGVLERLGPLVTGAVGQALSAAAARGEAVARDHLTALLESVIGAWLKARPEAACWVDLSRDRDGRVRLTARPEGLDCFVAPERVTIHLSFERRGERVDAEIPLSSARALTVVMDLLRGDFPPGVDLALADRDVRGVIAALESLGGLVPHAAAGAPFAPEDHAATSLTVTHMGHAFLIVDGASRRILFDPLLPSWRDEFVARPLTPRQLGPVDAVFFTQHHVEHMELATLLRLPHRVPVYVPGVTDPVLTPRCADYLRTLGFADVREIHAGDTVQVGDLQVRALPFMGKGREVLGYGANVYVVSLGHQRVLVHADASPDTAGRSLVSTGELAREVAAGGVIRAVYGSWWRRRTLLCLLSPLALMRPDVASDRWLADIACADASVEFLLALVRTCRARRFLAYAEGGAASFLPPDVLAAERALRAFHGRRREDVFAEINRLTGAEALAARPYQQVSLGAREAEELWIGP